MRKRRDRVVVFRLTEEEYDGLRRICETRSGRSLSEFARSELLGSMRLTDAVLPLDQWGSIERRVAELEAGLRDLGRRIDSVPSPGVVQ